MIYTYTYLPHRIEGFHKKISCFFRKLFETDAADFDEEILCEKDFIPIVNASAKRLKEKMKTICIKYHALSDEEKKTVRKAFEVNSHIREICEDKKCHPIKYDEISETIRQDLKDFCMMLWKEYPQNQEISRTFGTIQEHFNHFKQLRENHRMVCPFCGLQGLKPLTEDDKDRNRDEYDHIAPKAFYPFVSVNFENLAPICHGCNTDEKHATDMFYRSDGQRRQVLYPYDSSYHPEELSIEIISHQTYNPLNFHTLLKDIDWDIAVRMAGKEEEFLTTWADVYHIKKRYKNSLKTYQEVWYDDFIKKYKRGVGDKKSWQKIKDEILEDIKDRIFRPLGILEYIYVNYLLSLDSFKRYLKTMYPE